MLQQNFCQSEKTQAAAAKRSDPNLKQDPIKVIVAIDCGDKVTAMDGGAQGEQGQVVSAPGGLKPDLWHTCSCRVSLPGRIKVFSSALIQKACVALPTVLTHNDSGKNRDGVALFDHSEIAFLLFFLSFFFESEAGHLLQATVDVLITFYCWRPNLI